MDEQVRERETIEIDVLGIVQHILKHWWVILLITVGTCLLTYFYLDSFVAPKYQSSTSIYVLQSNSGSDSFSMSDLQIAATLMEDYIAIAKSELALDELSSRLEQEAFLAYSVEELKTMISVGSSASRIIEIRVTGYEPEDVYKITTIFGEVAAETISKLTNSDLTSVINRAKLAKAPSSPRMKRAMVMACAVGVFLACVFLMILYVADDNVKSEDDVMRYFGIPTLACIPYDKRRDRGEHNTLHTIQKNLTKKKK